MGRRWDVVKRWKNECYFQFVPVFNGSGNWMTISPAVVVGHVFDVISPVKYDRSQVSEQETEDREAVETYRVDTGNRDIDVIIRNFNPGVSLKDLTQAELFDVLRGLDLAKAGLEEWGSDWLRVRRHLR